MHLSYQFFMYMQLNIMEKIKIKKFDDMEFYKPCIIEIIGPGITPKNIFSNELIISMQDKNKLNISKTKIELLTNPPQFHLTIFSYDYIQNYPTSLYNFTLYKSFDKLKDYYLLRKYHSKIKTNLELEIVLIDTNLNFRRGNEYTKYIYKMMKNHKKLNILIIYYAYYMNIFIDIKPNYYIFMDNCFTDDLRIIYNKFYTKDKYTFSKFKKIYKKITCCDDNHINGKMVLKSNSLNKFYKLGTLLNSEKERKKIKYADPNYDPMSDESNIRFF